MRRTLAAIVSLCCLSAPGARADEREVVAFAAGKFAKTHGAEYCCYSCDDAPTASVQAQKFLEGGFAGYTRRISNLDLWVDGRDFTDPVQYSWGADDRDGSGTDFADVVFFSGHGFWRADLNTAVITMGDREAGQSCLPTLADDDGQARHMLFGNGGDNAETRVFVVFACNSAQWELFDARAYSGLSHPNGQFNMLNGFHGILYENSGINEDLRNYSVAAKHDGIGDAWLDYMYDPRTPSYTNCPMSIGWGESRDEIADFYHNAGWMDLRDNGARRWIQRFYVCGCDPAGGVRTTDC